jgi:hypothetical protein
MQVTTTPALPCGKKAVELWRAQGKLEPQILESRVATTYLLLGEEDISVARGYSIAFWMMGGAFLFLLAK